MILYILHSTPHILWTNRLAHIVKLIYLYFIYNWLILYYKKIRHFIVLIWFDLSGFTIIIKYQTVWNLRCFSKILYTIWHKCDSCWCELYHSVLKGFHEKCWVQIELSDFTIGVFLFQGKNVKSQRLWYKSIHLAFLLSGRNNWDILRPPLWLCFPVGWYKADTIGESRAQCNPAWMT